MERFSDSHFGLRDLSKTLHWSTDTKDFKITKPTFICLGGNGVIDTHKANGQAARNERLLGLKPKNADQYCTYHNIDIISFSYSRDKEDAQAGNISLEESKAFLNQLFIPLFFDDNGKRYTKQKCAKNFSKIIFSTHCYGAECVNNFLYDLKVFLLKNNFSSDEVDDIYSHSFHLSYSPLFREDNFLPFMQINSMEDSFSKDYLMETTFKNKFGYELNGVKICYDKKHMYRYIIDHKCLPIHKEICVYTSKLLNIKTKKGFEPADEHTSLYIDLDENYRCSKNSKGAKNSECCSLITSMALAMAGARALNIHNNNQKLEPTNLEEIYLAVQDVLEGFKEEDLEK